jgi:hypothetical protein
VKEQPVASTSLQFPVQVRHERDPYLYFLDISDGSLDFGLTTGEKVLHWPSHQEYHSIPVICSEASLEDLIPFCAVGDRVHTAGDWRCHHRHYVPCLLLHREVCLGLCIWWDEGASTKRSWRGTV